MLKFYIKQLEILDLATKINDGSITQINFIHLLIHSGVCHVGLIDGPCEASAQKISLFSAFHLFYLTPTSVICLLNRT